MCSSSYWLHSVTCLSDYCCAIYCTLSAGSILDERVVTDSKNNKFLLFIITNFIPKEMWPFCFTLETVKFRFLTAFEGIYFESKTQLLRQLWHCTHFVPTEYQRLWVFYVPLTAFSSHHCDFFSNLLLWQSRSVIKLLNIWSVNCTHSTPKEHVKMPWSCSTLSKMARNFTRLDRSWDL